MKKGISKVFIKEDKDGKGFNMVVCGDQESVEALVLNICHKSAFFGTYMDFEETLQKLENKPEELGFKCVPMVLPETGAYKLYYGLGELTLIQNEEDHYNYVKWLKGKLNLLSFEAVNDLLRSGKSWEKLSVGIYEQKKEEQLS